LGGDAGNRGGGRRGSGHGMLRSGGMQVLTDVAPDGTYGGDTPGAWPCLGVHPGTISRLPRNGVTGIPRNGVTGNTPERRHGYTPERRHGYTPERRHGYTPQRRHGYAPERRHGYAPERRHGYAPERRHGYAPERRHRVRAGTASPGTRRNGVTGYAPERRHRVRPGTASPVHPGTCSLVCSGTDSEPDLKRALNLTRDMS